MAEPQPDNLQFFANAYPDGIIGADVTGTITVMNSSAARMLGVRVPDAVGRPLGDVLLLQDAEGRSWLETNRPFAALNIQTAVPEQSWLLPSGEEVLITARIVRTHRLGAIVGLGIGLRSGRGRARLDRERSDLVATVAHELRSPLTGVKGFVQVLLTRWDKLSDEQKKLMLTTVSVDSDRLATLIADLLDVARLDTGRLSIYPRPVDGAELMRRVKESISAGTTREIVLHTDPTLPRIHADPDKFTQVATNLVENAVRHGQGRVRIRMEPDHGGAEIVLRVEDQGDGIPVEMRRRAFTKFWKSGASSGTGLGMYIVNGLTRAHGGEVEIGDAPGGGARVTVWWPTARDD